jgi:hypothetical protein
MYQKPTVPRSIGGVLDDTLQLFKASLSKCLLPALVISVVAAAFSFYQMSRLPLPTNAGTNVQAVLARYQNTSLSSFFLMVISLLFELLFYGTLVAIIMGVARSTAPSFATAVATSLRRLPAMIGAAIVIFIVSVVGFGIAIVPALVAIVRVRGVGSPAEVLGVVGPMILVCLLLILPVIYVVSRMQLFMVPLVSEPQGPLQSIGTSWRLVGGNWWRTTTVVFILGIIVYVLLIVIIAIAGAVMAVGSRPPASTGQLFSAVVLIGVLTGGLVRFVTAPLMVALHVTLYQDLLLRKGGGDLEARLGALPKG